MFTLEQSTSPEKSEEDLVEEREQLEAEIKSAIQGLSTATMSTISADDLATLISGFGAQIATALGDARASSEQAAKDDREAHAQQLQFVIKQLSSRSSSREYSGKSFEKVESQYAIQRANSRAIDWIRENHVDTESTAVDAWLDDFKENLASDHCRNVIDCAGYHCYTLQSNAWFDRVSDFEKEYRKHNQGIEKAGLKGGTFEGAYRRAAT